MEQLIAVVFDDATKAFEGLKALGNLDNEGEIAIYEAQTVAKAPGGKVSVLQEKDKLTWPIIASGTAVGAFIGMLGGPVGVFLGAAAGAMVGTIGDAKELGVTDEFVEEVSTALTPGKVALVADIDEERTTPLDMRMEGVGGVVFRRIRTVVETTQDDRDAAAHQAELDALKAERQQARADRLAKIDARIDHLRVKLESAIERKRAKMQLRQQQLDARIEILQAKANREAGELRQRQAARIAALRREYAEKAARG